jgi:hypothetical protein
MKQSQTDPPITAALPHFRCIKWPAPGKNQAAIPTSQARAGVGSLASTLSLSILLKFRPSIICTILLKLIDGVLKFYLNQGTIHFPKGLYQLF